MIPIDWTLPYEARSWIHRLDPRARIAAVAMLSTATIMLQHASGVAVMLFLGLFLTISARYTARQLGYRLLAISAFFVILVAFMPLRADYESGFALTYSKALAGEALMICGKSGAIMLFLIALVSTIEPTALGHALVHLHVPRKLVQLYLFTIRYFDVLRREMQVMHTAMLARAFRPKLSPHALHSYGNLVGMLLVRSLDRSERILRAMKCRGYEGYFYLFHHFHFTRRDVAFVALALAASLAGFVWGI